MNGQKTANRRTLLASALCGAVLTSWGQPALAQNQFPSKTMSFVVPYPAGGANDMLGRLIGQKMAEALNGTAMVDNKPGAAAMLGASAVARAPADGHTLLIGGLATHAASPNMLKADYDPLKDFESVGMIGSAPIIAITFNESPFKSLKDVVDAARKDPKGVMYGSSGNGSPLHLAGELFNQSTGTSITHIPYRGSAPALQDVMASQADFVFDPGIAFPHIKAGKVKLLAVVSEKRSPFFPDVPTVGEQGFKGANLDIWFGMWTPNNTPSDVVTRLNREIAKALAKTGGAIAIAGDLAITTNLSAGTVTLGAGDQIASTRTATIGTGGTLDLATFTTSPISMN